MDVPEDIRERAKDALMQAWLMSIFDQQIDIIAQALLSERLAQKERDAKIADAIDHNDEGSVGEQIASLIRQS